MSTQFRELAANQIVKHPKNVRQKAAADTELVESIKASGLVQPIVVAPINGEDKYILIAGHRRLDGCKKAGLKQIPAVIRGDLVTEGQQIEAMLIENGRRVDLSPIEEAEGYAQLELLGYKATSIATAVGRDIKTVRSRLKLLKLSASTRKKIHGGQMSLDDAAAFLEFADDPDATRRLEAAAKTGQLRHAVHELRGRKKRLADHAEKVAQVAELGGTPYTLPEGKGLWEAVSERIVARLWDPKEWADHAGHLAYLESGLDGTFPSIEVLCTSPDAHQEERDAAADQRRAEQEEENRRHEERIAAEDAASAVRIDSAMGFLGDGVKLPDVLVDLLRNLLPAALRELSEHSNLEAYFDALNVADPDRWDGMSLTRYYANEDRRRIAETLFEQHLEDIQNATSPQLSRHLAALLVAQAENQLGLISTWRQYGPVVEDYFFLLDAANHEHCDIDQELRAKANGTDKEADA